MLLRAPDAVMRRAQAEPLLFICLSVCHALSLFPFSLSPPLSLSLPLSLSDEGWAEGDMTPYAIDIDV
jgi:hypothetical protein